jgi:hypothetical protein
MAQPIRRHLGGLAIAVCAALTFALTGVPGVRAGEVVTCSYSSDGILQINIGLSAGATIKRDAAGNIAVVPWTCTHEGPGPTVNNTRLIKVFGGDGFQSLIVDLATGPLAPGSQNEVGTSEEIEISVLLGAGAHDSVVIQGSSSADAIRIGTKGSGGPINVPVPSINLNAGESNGVDADVTMSGVEKISVVVSGGRDTVSGEGGAGTGGSATLPLYVDGGSGSDVLTGGTKADYLIGGAGSDTVKGGQGPDELLTEDGVSGNDASSGGTGSDICESDPGDAETSCET